MKKDDYILSGAVEIWSDGGDVGSGRDLGPGRRFRRK